MNLLLLRESSVEYDHIVRVFMDISIVSLIHILQRLLWRCGVKIFFIFLFLLS